MKTLRELEDAAKKQPLPRHVAVIMDGNGRWAQGRGLPRTAGHVQGVKVVEKITEFASTIGLEALTLYSFSAENWKRPRAEIDFLMRLLAKYLKTKLQKFMKNNIRFSAIGRWEELPEVVVDLMRFTIEKTAGNTGMVLNLALNYGGRQELLDAVRKILARDRVKRLADAEVDDALVHACLYDPSLPDPDLLIRTSNEYRISNFLLWEIAYSEIVFTEKFWPDFEEADLLDAIAEFNTRERRYGGISAKPTSQATSR